MEHYVSNGLAKIWTTISDDDPYCEKPYLLLCGAGPGVNDGLNEVDPLFNPHFNTIRFNHRGCGTSTPDKNYHIETIINDIEEIRKYYRVDKWYVLGHSWGANIALFYALKYPAHCISMVYLCGTGIQNDQSWNEECARNAANQTSPERPPRVNIDDTMNYEVLDAEIRSFNQYIQQPMLLRQVSSLRVPVLVICGRQDIRPIWPAVQLSNLLPRGELVVLEECGHFPWITHSELLQKTIYAWFHRNGKNNKLL